MQAFITGVSGQDGSFLAELLLEKGYRVHGLVRRSSSNLFPLIDHLRSSPEFELHYGDVTDAQRVSALVRSIAPDEIYNLAAQSHVGLSFSQPHYTVSVDALGALNVLEAARMFHESRPVRVYQAGSSEMFGQVLEEPQTESTPFNPQSPYGCAKVFAHFQTSNYRKCYGLHASNGILFNHESERRGREFVTRKITLAAARIKLGMQDKLKLGNLAAKRDWGYAKDYVRAMWQMLQQDKPGDYVIATGKSTTVEQFAERTFGYLGMDWRDYVECDESLCRPSEVDSLRGDYSKAKRELGWEPQTNLNAIIQIMVDHDLKRLR